MQNKNNANAIPSIKSKLPASTCLVLAHVKQTQSRTEVIAAEKIALPFPRRENFECARTRAEPDIQIRNPTSLSKPRKSVKKRSIAVKRNAHFNERRIHASPANNDTGKRT